MIPTHPYGVLPAYTTLAVEMHPGLTLIPKLNPENPNTNHSGGPPGGHSRTGPQRTPEGCICRRTGCTYITSLKKKGSFGKLSSWRGIVEVMNRFFDIWLAIHSNDEMKARVTIWFSRSFWVGEDWPHRKLYKCVNSLCWTAHASGILPRASVQVAPRVEGKSAVPIAWFSRRWITRVFTKNTPSVYKLVVGVAAPDHPCRKNVIGYNFRWRASRWLSDFDN